MKHILDSDMVSLPHGSSIDIPSISEFIKWKETIVVVRQIHGAEVVLLIGSIH